MDLVQRRLDRCPGTFLFSLFLSVALAYQPLFPWRRPGSLLFSNNQMSRGSTNIKKNYHGHMVSEDEAVKLVKMVLRFFSELLLNLKSFFSGDTATTMKHHN